MRSIKKGVFVDINLLKEVEQRSKSNSKDPIVTQSRACTIVPEFVGYTFMIHNGKKYTRVYISSDMIGHKLGEFSFTRVFKEHTVVTKRSRKKVKR